MDNQKFYEVSAVVQLLLGLDAFLPQEHDFLSLVFQLLAELQLLLRKLAFDGPTIAAV